MRFFIQLTLARVSSARGRSQKMSGRRLGTSVIAFAGQEGQDSNLFVKDLVKIDKFLPVLTRRLRQLVAGNF